jgi:hypothetical protein
LTLRWQISAGEITEWLWPLLFAFSVLASAWVLHDARGRRLPACAVAVWTLAALIYAPVVLPLYLITRIFKPYPAAHDDDDSTETTTPADTGVAGLKETGRDELEETGAATVVPPRGEIPDEASQQAALRSDGKQAAPHDDGEQVAPELSPTIPASLRLKRRALPLLYAFALLLAGAVYFYRDYHSFDAHLMRAANAQLRNRRNDAIREYRAALRLADDAHTHKLLGILLAQAGQTEAALAEFRAAERGGEPDELLPYRIASALDTLGRAAEAAGEYRKFLQGSLCTRRSPDVRCVEASARAG